MSEKPEEKEVTYNLQPFRSAVFRGLALVLPPLLTFVILLWIANSVEKILNPLESWTRRATVWFMDDTKTNDEIVAKIAEGASDNELATELLRKRADASDTSPQQAALDVVNGSGEPDLKQIAAAVARIEQRLQQDAGFTTDSQFDPKRDEPQVNDNETVYVALSNGEWIPAYVRNAVVKHVQESGESLERNTGNGYYHHYVKHSILKRTRVIPVFFAGFILLMYLLGKFLAAGVGRYFWNAAEHVITQLPIIRTVYSSVKQVTDFFVGESEVSEFQRVVAVEYPRKGMWSVGFVTGESMLTIRGAAQGEPIVSVLMPTSPVPGTGFTVTVRKSETIDLDIPVEQALQFVVSCGVVVPDEEVQEQIHAKIEESSDEPCELTS